MKKDYKQYWNKFVSLLSNLCSCSKTHRNVVSDDNEKTAYCVQLKETQEVYDHLFKNNISFIEVRVPRLIETPSLDKGEIISVHLTKKEKREFKLLFEKYILEFEESATTQY